MTEDKTGRRCGCIGLIGAPNAGKSTLVNKLVGTKVSIVTHKVQTTRSRVVGIAMNGDSQIVLVDTPGIFKPGRRLDKAMVGTAWREAHNADVIAVLMDASHGRRTKEEQLILSELEKREIHQKVVLILNKIDLIPREKLLHMAQEFHDTSLFSEIYMVSALSGDGCDKMLSDFGKFVPKAEWMYDEDIVSDMPVRMLAAEITREKLFQQLHEEIPYQCAIETESWEMSGKGEPVISQVIYVISSRHKAMILGKKGQKIKNIGIKAREELSELLEQKIHLKLFVKVKENWMDDPERYSEWGLEFS